MLDYKKLCTDVTHKMASVGEWANNPQNKPLSSQVYYKIITLPILEEKRMLEERRERGGLIKPCEISVTIKEIELSESSYVQRLAIATGLFLSCAALWNVWMGILIATLVALITFVIHDIKRARISRKIQCAADLIRSRFIDSGCADKNDVNQVIAELPEEEFTRIRGACVGLNKSYFDKV